MTAHEPSTTESTSVVRGILAEFADPDALVSAARAVRESGLKRWDCHSPFPVHGIDGAMGIRPTILPWLVFGAGVTGAIVAIAMQWWMNAVNYPMNISGKPLFSLPANIPVAFELIILFAALTAFAGVLMLNCLPRYNNPLLDTERFRRATSDRFFVVVDADDPAFNLNSLRNLLQSAGATAVEEVLGPSRPASIPLAVHLAGIVALCVALIPPLLIAKDRRTTSETPRMHPVRDMDDQPRFHPQGSTPLFANGQMARPPVAGTVAYGDLRANEHFEQGLQGTEFAATFPAEILPVTMERMKRGQERFRIYCAPCHGLVGEGNGITSVRALARADSPGWVPPLSLHTQGVREQPVGKIFNTISNGIRTMPGYAAQVPPADRWAIVVYVLALQRSQNGALEDLPPDVRQQLELRDIKN